jgi:pimeloyl-ACP methyl ester carboxylesterase
MPRPYRAEMDAAPVTQVWTRVGAGRVHARAAGPRDGGRTPVVLLHGLGMSSRYFERALGLLGVDRRVLAPDLPGYGRSTRPERPLRLFEFADVIVRWLDAQDLERIALVGHSLGCQLAGEIAARYPDRITRVVLASPARDLAGMLRLGEMTTIAGAPHGLPWSSAARFTATVRSFLDR